MKDQHFVMFFGPLASKLIKRRANWPSIACFCIQMPVNLQNSILKDSKQHHSSEHLSKWASKPHLRTEVKQRFHSIALLFRTDYKWLYKDTYLFLVRSLKYCELKRYTRHLFAAITLPPESFYAYVKERVNLLPFLRNNCFGWNVYLYILLVHFASSKPW